jgi:hypothetical protein
MYGITELKWHKLYKYNWELKHKWINLVYNKRLEEDLDKISIRNQRLMFKKLIFQSDKGR